MTQILTNNKTNCELAIKGLEYVFDPEIGLNVVDLGLIYEIQFEEEKKAISCVMTLTSEFCPMGESILDNAKRSLQSSFPEYSIQVSLTFEPAWNYERISEIGKKFLNR